jgi:hypothetical protein
MRRHLVVAALAVAGVLVWAGTASAATELTLCIKGPDIRTAATCKANETTFQVVSAADHNALGQRVTTLEGKVNALETLLAGVTRPDAGTLRFTGMNLQVVNGGGTTDGSDNGLGNIIVGYNTDGSFDGLETRTGSHNVVIGDDHTWTKSAGFVSGLNNTLTGLWSFASGGFNKATSESSFVAGGEGNTASGISSFVGGGGQNTASGAESFVGGGGANTASGTWSFAAGGEFNEASGFDSFVGGGADNTASGDQSFVGGGFNNTAGPGTCGYVITAVFGTC